MTKEMQSQSTFLRFRRFLRWPVSFVVNGPRWTFRHIKVSGKLK